MIVLWKIAKRVDTLDHRRTYMVSCLHNAMIDEVRSRRKHPAFALFSTLMNPEVSASYTDTQERIAARDDLEAVLKSASTRPILPGLRSGVRRKIQAELRRPPKPPRRRRPVKSLQ